MEYTSMKSSLDKLMFFNDLQKKQTEIIKVMYKDIDSLLFLWQQYHKELFKKPEIFENILQHLDEWKNDFLNKTTMFPSASTPQESLVNHLNNLTIYKEALEKEQNLDIESSLKDSLDTAIGIKFEMNLCLPTREEILNGSV